MNASVKRMYIKSKKESNKNAMDRVATDKTAMSRTIKNKTIKGRNEIKRSVKSRMESNRADRLEDMLIDDIVFDIIDFYKKYLSKFGFKVKDSFVKDPLSQSIVLLAEAGIEGVGIAVLDVMFDPGIAYEDIEQDASLVIQVWSAIPVKHEVLIDVLNQKMDADVPYKGIKSKELMMYEEDIGLEDFKENKELHLKVVERLEDAIEQSWFDIDSIVADKKGSKKLEGVRMYRDKVKVRCGKEIRIK